MSRSTTVKRTATTTRELHSEWRYRAEGALAATAILLTLLVGMLLWLANLPAPLTWGH